MQYYTKNNGEKLAYLQTKRHQPHVVFLSGFKSDMQGTKAQAVDHWCAEHGHSFTRFDYRGHGQSDGQFLDGCISDWLEDTLDILDQVVAGPCIVIGSSMGGWLALLAALARPAQIKAIIGIAPAPDFTEKLIWQAATNVQQQQLLDQGYFDIPNCYNDAEPFRITRKLIKDGRQHLLLDEPEDKRQNAQENTRLKNLTIPIRLLHGMCDEDVPWQMSAEIAQRVGSADVQIHYIKNAGHRMSEPEQLALLMQMLLDLCPPADWRGPDPATSAG